MVRIATIRTKICLSRFNVITLLFLSFLIAGVFYIPFTGSAKAQKLSSNTSISDADVSFVGEGAEDYSGWSVSSAGDVNGDGYDDILIGTPENNVGKSLDAGQTYLILGKATGWAMDTSLSEADASFVGENAYDYSGSSVASAGDVNGDGYDDILISAPKNNFGESIDAGQTYLILGKATGWAMDTSLSEADASFVGEKDYDYSGSSVASAGDVDGDGYDDILIGAPNNDEGGDNAGQTYLILGKATGWDIDTSLSDADASFIGENAGDHSGHSVASAGNVNGGSYDDILIGSPTYDGDGGSNTGKTYLIFGMKPCAIRPSEGFDIEWVDWEMDIKLSDADASFIGENEGDLSGISVASAGDVDGDGYDDILIGSPTNDDDGDHAGKTYLILGKATTSWDIGTSLSNADASFWGEVDNDWSGYSVASAGDVDGDGYDDILIGAYANDDGGDNAGQTYLVLGKATGWTMDTDLSLADASFIGEDADDRSGCSVASAGDVDGDGYDDILIGAYRNDAGGSELGKTYLFLGEAPPDAPNSPQCEGQTNPAWISNTLPEFSWSFSDPNVGDIQSAYQVLVASSSANLADDSGDMWDSGKVTSSDSTNIFYDGSDLSWSATYYWKVKTWDDDDYEGPYCSEQTFITNDPPEGEGFNWELTGIITGIIFGVIAAIGTIITVFVTLSRRRNK